MTIVAVHCDTVQECINIANSYPDSQFVQILSTDDVTSYMISCYCWVILRGNDFFVKEIKQHYGDKAR